MSTTLEKNIEANNNVEKKLEELKLTNGDSKPETRINGFIKESTNDLGSASDESSLFDSKLVQGLDFSHYQIFRPPISPGSPGEGIRVRALRIDDFENGFLEILAQLTKVGDISKSDFTKRFEFMRNCNGSYFVTVIEDIEKKKIIGTATLVVERKFIRGCGKRGIIEDVVVSDEYRGRQLGKLICCTLIELGKTLGCYKITLNCTDQMIKFYCSLGFHVEPSNANFLQIRF